MTKNNKDRKEEEKNKCDCGCNNCNCNEPDAAGNCECGCEDCGSENEYCGCGEGCSCNENESVQTEDYLLMAKRIQAEFDNYRKRVELQLMLIKQEGFITAINAFLPSIDAIVKAKEMIKDAAALKGIELIETSLLNSLKQLRIEPIETTGKMFDPNFHHALATVEDKNKKSGEIIQEAQKGFRLGDRVIRYSQVIIVK